MLLSVMILNTLLAQRAIERPVLSGYAQGYSPNEYIGTKLLKILRVPVGQTRIPKFGKEQFMNHSTERAPGGKVQRIDVSNTYVDFNLKNYPLAAGIDDQERIQGGASLLDLEKVKVDVLLSDLFNGMENRIAAKLLAAGSYANSNKATKTSTDKWSADTGNPFNHIEEGIEAVRTQIGRRPNTLTFGATAWKAFVQNAKVLAKMQFSGMTPLDQTMVARYFRMKDVYVGDAVKATNAGVMSDVWKVGDNHAVILNVVPDGEPKLPVPATG